MAALFHTYYFNILLILFIMTITFVSLVDKANTQNQKFPYP